MCENWSSSQLNVVNLASWHKKYSAILIMLSMKMQEPFDPVGVTFKLWVTYSMVGTFTQVTGVAEQRNANSFLTPTLGKRYVAVLVKCVAGLFGYLHVTCL